MNLKLFGRELGGKPSKNATALVGPSGSDEIMITHLDGPLDLDAHDYLAFSVDANENANFASALIPFAGDIANAVAQYNQAIVKFPPWKRMERSYRT